MISTTRDLRENPREECNPSGGSVRVKEGIQSNRRRRLTGGV